MIYVASDLSGGTPLAVRDELWITALRVRIRSEASIILAARAREYAARARWRCMLSRYRRWPQRARDGARGRVIPFRRRLASR